MSDTIAGENSTATMINKSHGTAVGYATHTLFYIIHCSFVSHFPFIYLSLVPTAKYIRT
jgi:hypothetical protein